MRRVPAILFSCSNLVFLMDTCKLETFSNIIFTSTVGEESNVSEFYFTGYFSDSMLPFPELRSPNVFLISQRQMKKAVPEVVKLHKIAKVI